MDVVAEESVDHMVIDEEAAPVIHDDIDLYDWDDPQAVTTYVEEIHDYMKEIEVRIDRIFIITNESVTTLLMIEVQYMVSPDYMKNQVDVNEKMRAILLDWLVEVHRMFKLLPETLFLVHPLLHESC